MATAPTAAVAVALAAAIVVMAALVMMAVPMTSTRAWAMAVRTPMTAALAVAALGLLVLARYVSCSGIGLWDL